MRKLFLYCLLVGFIAVVFHHDWKSLPSHSGKAINQLTDTIFNDTLTPTDKQLFFDEVLGREIRVAENHAPSCEIDTTLTPTPKQLFFPDIIFGREIRLADIWETVSRVLAILSLLGTSALAFVLGVRGIGRFAHEHAPHGSAKMGAKSNLLLDGRHRFCAGNGAASAALVGSNT